MGAWRRSSDKGRKVQSHENMPAWPDTSVYQQRMKRHLVTELGTDKSTESFEHFGNKYGSDSKFDRHITQFKSRIWFQFKLH